ncbi:glycoside hydrolase family 65 protein [Brachybacterium saurashtrense]|uniref:Glycoside hydrolase family 65 protein n=1 Tax=Brachybacterium saurashtrense TaxID=556288 RepID=A0A345YKQ6_9MICO|nr:glycosyl hydrolase family 65 protein [Brachybacterium saurashtrense]AXK44508.1 glycoside hydrolase family 65 protein [Brachybacterium saurashtrense]RRR23120.1 glycoside hydrolase family 65 protein [Brachybacterium saurashtrense]
MNRRRAVPTDPVDRTHFPVDEWRLVESRPAQDLGLVETLFATANGYLGMRGTPSEGRDAESHGTFLNGFHETWQINHAESAFGFARTGQTMISVPDSSVMKLYVDDEPLLLSIADLEEYERWIDFREGVLHRELIWRTPAGKRVRVSTSRMVSFPERHLALMTLRVEMLEGSAPIAISSQVINRQDFRDDFGKGVDGGPITDKDDPRRTTDFTHRVLEPLQDWHSERRMLLGYRVANSGMTMAVGADHEVFSDAEVETLVDTVPDRGRQVTRAHLEQGSSLTLHKAVSYHSSRSVPHRELFDRCRRTLDRVRSDGFEAQYRAQREYLAEFWESSDVELPGQPAVQQATRWNLYQLAQATARSDQWGIPAKGVTGSGYEGHYFWDSEVYVVPFLTFTQPRWARNALRFRTAMLPKARERARELNQRGALFPWRTINGDEASAYYAAGTAQYHIDADVAYAFAQYVDVTGDLDFQRRDGVQVLVETARMWADLGFWRLRADGSSSFHINGVTGPDEYTTVVNNNMFTNVMARYNLRRAARAVRDLRAADEIAYDALRVELELDELELQQWEACADGMHVAKDESLGIHLQEDRFLEREVWDLASTPEEAFPLLLNFHPLVIYRFQVLKQADVVLALFLRGSEFTAEEKRADFEYYDPITTGDSSLSAVVQSIMAAEVGHQTAALDYFRAGLFVDLGNLHHNTADGVHIASAGGVWNALVHGFGGMRHDEGRISFDPRLPADWPELSFPLTVRGSRVRVHLVREEISFTLLAGEEIEVSVRGQDVVVTAAGTAVPLADQGPVLDDAVLSRPVGLGDERADGSIVTSYVPGDPEDPWEYPVASDPDDIIDES